MNGEKKSNGLLIGIAGVAAVAGVIAAGLAVFGFIEIRELQQLTAGQQVQIKNLRADAAGELKAEMADLQSAVEGLDDDNRKLGDRLAKYVADLNELGPKAALNSEMAGIVVEDLKKKILEPIEIDDLEKLGTAASIKQMKKRMDEIRKRNSELEEFLEWNGAGRRLIEPGMSISVYKVQQLQDTAPVLLLQTSPRQEPEVKKKFDLKKGEKSELGDGKYGSEFMLKSLGQRWLGVLELNCKTKNDAEILDVEFKTDADALSMTQGYKFTEAVWNHALPKKTWWTAQISFLRPADIGLSVITDTDPEDMTCYYSVDWDTTTEKLNNFWSKIERNEN